MADKPLTPKQERFVQEFLVDLNATAAYKRAGYKVKNDNAAAASASQLLRNPKVQEAIEKGRHAASKRTEITLDRWLAELAAIAFSDPRRLYQEDGSLRPIGELEDEVAATVARVEAFEELEGRGDNRALVGFTKKVRLWDKLSALEKIGKHLGFLKDRHEHSGPNGGPIPLKYDDLSDAEIEDRIRELDARLPRAAGGPGGKAGKA